MEDKNIDVPTFIGKSWKEGETMDWDKICFVRAVNGWEQLQVKETDGEKRVVSQSALNSTRGEVPRLTVHWTLNHRVERHIWGSWDEAPITIIAPGESTIKENGKPLSLYAVDTFWSKDVVIPENSVIIYSGDIPTEFLNVKGNFIKSPVGEEEIQKARALKDISLKELKKHNVEKYEELESEYFQMTAEIAERVNEKVNENIERMGYTVFDGDNGTYMHMRGLDHAINSLVEKEGLDTFIHSDSIMHAIENPTLTLAMIEPDKLFEKSKNSSQYQSAVHDMRNTMENINKDDPKYDKDAVSVFCAELYSVFKKYPDRVLNDKWGLMETIVFFDENPQIRDTITKWMEKDGSDTKEFKNLTSVIKILNLDECKKDIDRWSENGGELIIKKTIKDTNINLICNLLEGYFIDKYEVFKDIEALPVGSDTYEFRFSKTS